VADLVAVREESEKHRRRASSAAEIATETERIREGTDRGNGRWEKKNVKIISGSPDPEIQNERR
jgi:hypothetical protein